MAMPWELDKPTGPQPGTAAMPWDLDAPTNAVARQAPVATQQAQTPRTNLLLDSLSDGPSRLPNSIADTRAAPLPMSDEFGADFARYFADNPANMTAIRPSTDPAADEAALLRDIQLSRDPVNRSETYKMQQLARGVSSDVVGAPVDIVSMLGNAQLWGLDKIAQGAGYVTGNDLGIDARIPYDLPGSSDWIEGGKRAGVDAIASYLAENYGQTPMAEDETLTIPPEDVSAQDRILGSGLRFGGGALLTGGVLAAKNATNPAKSGLMSVLEAPYSSNATKALRGDLAAGAGSGVVSEAYNEYAPQAVKDALGPIGNVLAALMGGVGGSTLNSVGTSVAEGAKNAIRDSEVLAPVFRDPSTPFSDELGRSLRPSEMDMAARIAQNMPTDKAKAVKNIRQGGEDFAFVPEDARPTTGMLANDIGMGLNENVARAKQPQRFLERDAARNVEANKQLDKAVPPFAVSRDLPDTATFVYDTEMQRAQNRLDRAKTARDTGAADIQAQDAALAEARNRQPQVSSNLSTEFNRQLDDATATKNAKYAEIPDDTAIAAKPLYEELMAIEESVPRAARANTDYATAAKRIGDLIRNPETGGFQDLTYGDVKVLKTEISAARKEAVAAGRDVTQLDKLNNLLGRKIDETNPEAARYFGEEFAPRFRTGRSGEYANTLKRAVKTGDESSATRPSEFAGKFLTKPEDAAALQRAVDVNGNPVTAENATQWMLGDLARSNVTKDGALRYDKFKQWANKNKAVIDQFPAMRSRIDTELQRAERGGKLSKQLADEVVAAETNLANTQTDLRRSALQSAIGRNPENMINDIMSSGDPENQMKDLLKRLPSDKKTMDGLKSSVRDWIRDKSGTTANITGDDGTKISRARLKTLFRKHENTLSKVYTPSEMNNLRQAHKLLDVAGNLDLKATTGSQTADKLASFFNADKDKIKSNMRMFEVAAKARYGMLKGGGLTRTVGLLVDALAGMSTKPKAVENAIYEMYFNPDLATHLLTRNVKEVGTPAWNKRLNQLLSTAEGNRDEDEK